MDIKSIVGETLTYVDDCGDEIMLTTASGRKIRIYHDQDCCESVRVWDTYGNWHDLIGKVIVDASEEIVDIEPEIEPYNSCTRTNLTFKVDGATVISKWIGESNGYYSENVDLEELGKDGRWN